MVGFWFANGGQFRAPGECAPRGREVCNSARPSGNFSGGAIRNDGTATIRYSTLVGNSADDFAGGAIFNQGPMVIMKSKLIRNTAGEGGDGAIFNTGSSGSQALTLYRTAPTVAWPRARSVPTAET